MKRRLLALLVLLAPAPGLAAVPRVPGALPGISAAAAAPRLAPPVLAPNPTDAQLEGMFAALRPGSDAVRAMNGRRGFAAGASAVLFEHARIREQFLPALKRSESGWRGRAFVQAAEDVLSVAEDPAAWDFLHALGRRAAYVLFDDDLEIRTKRRLPRNPLKSGEYWDLASGPAARDLIVQDLEPGTHYSFFDVSPFVASYLQTGAALKGANATAFEKDVMTLTRPETPLAVLRSKNAIAYVPGLERKLEEMSDWLAPGGRLVLQNDPRDVQRQALLAKHSPLALRLLEQGWGFSFEFASAPRSRHALDTLIFTRPSGLIRPRSADAARKIWRRYEDAARERGARGE